MDNTALFRVLQRLPIITHAFVLLLAMFGPWLCPYVLAAVFLFTNVNFLSSQVRMAYGMMRCYWAIRTHWKTDWWSVYLRGIQSAPIDALDTRYSPLTLQHLIIIPSYKETLSTLRQTLAILASHPLAPHAYNVCLAMEQREEGASQKGHLLAEEFEGKFADITVTLHPGDIQEEVPGKGSNTRWAARWMAEHHSMRTNAPQRNSLAQSQDLSLHSHTVDMDAVITIMDADTAFAADYFLAVSVRYLLASPETRQVMMFVPPIIFDRNQSEVPAVTRVTDIMWSTAGISGIYPSSTIKIPTSAYSMSLSLATHVGFWDAGAGAIGEDMHMFCKSLFDTNGHLHVETIYSPASQCNVIGSSSLQDSGYIITFLSNCHARWTQAVRHMWGSLDTGYVARRLLTRDFGVSYEREIEHRLHRVDMRQTIQDSSSRNSATDTTTEYRQVQPVQHKRASSHPSRSLVLPPKWIQEVSSTSTSDEEASFAASTSSSPSSRGQERTIGAKRPTSSSSHYSYSSLDEECDLDSCKSKPGSNVEAAFQSRPQDHPSTCFPRVRKVKKFPFIVLTLRMYEAHIMLAHLFILINALIVLPKLCAYLERELARQIEVWGRTSSVTNPYEVGDKTNGTSLAWALLGGLWVEQSEILSRTVGICNRLGVVGVIATVVTFIFHDLYHREAGKRWTRKGVNYSLPSNVETMELGHQAHSILAPHGTPYLGIPPHPHSARRMPWCFFDYLAVPGGLVFGVAPLLYAQVCHLWTDRLAYKVSAKPQQGR